MLTNHFHFRIGDQYEKYEFNLFPVPETNTYYDSYLYFGESQIYFNELIVIRAVLKFNADILSLIVLEFSNNDFNTIKEYLSNHQEEDIFGTKKVTLTTNNRRNICLVEIGGK